MIVSDCHFSWSRIEDKWESNPVLRLDRLTNNNLVDIVELVPVFVLLVGIPKQGLEPRSARDRHIQSLGGVERFQVKQVLAIRVLSLVRQKLRRQSVQHRLLCQRQLPLSIPTINLVCVLQRFGHVEPLSHWRIVILVQLELNRVQRVNVQDIVTKVDWRFLVVERGKPHSLEMTTIAFLPTHHQPRRTPLGYKHGLNHSRGFRHKCNSTSHVVHHLHVLNLLPWHWHVLQQLVRSVGNILQRSNVHSFVVTKLARAHVTVILDYLT